MHFDRIFYIQNIKIVLIRYFNAITVISRCFPLPDARPEKNHSSPSIDHSYYQTTAIAHT